MENLYCQLLFIITQRDKEKWINGNYKIENLRSAFFFQTITWLSPKRHGGSRKKRRRKVPCWIHSTSLCSWMKPRTNPLEIREDFFLPFFPRTYVPYHLTTDLLFYYSPKNNHPRNYDLRPRISWLSVFRPQSTLAIRKKKETVVEVRSTTI